MQEYTVWQLANMADCLSPDAVDSPGAEWLVRVAEDAAELVDDNTDAIDADDLRDGLSERADSIVPIYTHERWRVFVDLGAYNEDPTELGCDGSDMTQAAAVCLYLIAERLMGAVVESELEARDEDEDEDEEVAEP